jgi:hypothetical protein
MLHSTRTHRPRTRRHTVSCKGRKIQEKKRMMTVHTIRRFVTSTCLSFFHYRLYLFLFSWDKIEHQRRRLYAGRSFQIVSICGGAVDARVKVGKKLPSPAFVDRENISMDEALLFFAVVLFGSNLQQFQLLQRWFPPSVSLLITSLCRVGTCSPTLASGGGGAGLGPYHTTPKRRGFLPFEV